MKILSSIDVGLIGPLPPPNGGMANQVNQLYRLLGEEGINVTLLQTNPPYPFNWLSRLKGIRAVVRLLIYIFQVWKLARKVNVIHVFSNSGWSWQLFSMPALWIAAFHHTPVIINYRGGEARDYLNRSIRYVRPSLNLAKSIVVPSKFLQEVFAEFGFSARIIPNIIDTDKFAPLGHSINSHFIVARNLEQIYGNDTAIKALRIVRNQIPGAHLTIAGSGEQKEFLEKLVTELDLEGCVEFTGRLQPEKMVKLYQSADIMLNPSRVDNMPNSILEAMASGVPVITTNVGGIPYMVIDGVTAQCVPPDNPEVMAAQMVSLLSDLEKYQNLRQNALDDVQQYSWKNVKKLWIEQYCSLTVS